MRPRALMVTVLCITFLQVHADDVDDDSCILKTELVLHQLQKYSQVANDRYAKCATDRIQEETLISKVLDHTTNLIQQQTQEFNLKVLMITEHLEKLQTQLQKDIKCSKLQGLDKTQFFTVSNKSFYITETNLKWAEARDLCEWRGMRLPTLKSLPLLRKVSDELKNRSWGNLYFWVSATDIGWTPGHFVWTDGIQVDNATWFNGDPQQPDSFGVGKEACAYLYTKHATLGDDSCATTKYIFCEVPHESLHCV